LARELIFVFFQNQIDALSNVLSHRNLGFLVEQFEGLVLLGRNVDSRADLFSRHDVRDAMSTVVEGNKMTKKQILKRALAVVSLVGLCSCAATKASETGAAGASGNAQTLSESIKHRKNDGETATEFDLNKDKKTDVWTYTVPGKSADGKAVDRIVRKELDINWDGKIDISRSYDEKEQISREAIDLDFDGKVDQVNFYEKGTIVRKERDLSSAGKPSLWLYFEKGKLVRKERDNNSDGKVDYWEYWENEQVDRVGEDLDGDGNVDKWTKNPDSES
jgi:antitoxin component YwqK of YwqJK toxin-antitoxin module